MNLILGLLFICSWALIETSSHKKGFTGKPIVSCDFKTMVVDIKVDNKTDIFVDNFSKVQECQGTRTKHILKFKFPLKGKSHQCGIQKLKQLKTNDHIYYTVLTVHTTTKHEGMKENKMTIYCKAPKHHHRYRRQGELPPDFEEAQVNISHEVANEAPFPQIRMTINKNGQPTSYRYAIPLATPLTMDIEQDLDSAKFYGMKVKEVRVSNNVDEKMQTLVKNSCSASKKVVTSEFRKEGNTHLQANFLSFKFPHSAYIKFSATVQICLKECSPTMCNGIPGYGRKRRSEMSNTSSYELDVETTLMMSDPQPGEVEKWGELIIKKDNDNKITEIAAQVERPKLAGASSSLSPSMSMLSSILTSTGLVMLLRKL